MRVKITKSFRIKLNEQVNYIARDKPAAARKFKSKLLDEINDLPKMPFKNRKSIFFDRVDVRDLIVKGYVIVYKINSSEDTIDVFGFTKGMMSLWIKFLKRFELKWHSIWPLSLML